MCTTLTVTLQTWTQPWVHFLICWKKDEESTQSIVVVDTYISLLTKWKLFPWLWACIEWREVCDSQTFDVRRGERSRFPVLTKSRAASGNENGTIKNWREICNQSLLSCYVELRWVTFKTYLNPVVTSVKFKANKADLGKITNQGNSLII